MEAYKLKVLIVEDNLSFALELEMLVQEIGYHVVGRVDNSAEALELILGEEPDIVLMDIGIKGKLSGTEVAEKVVHLDIPILFITTFDDKENYEDAKKSNMIGYLVKPLQKYSLRTALELAFNNAHNLTLKKKEDSSPDHFLSKEFLFFKKKEVFHKVALRHITFISADNNYVKTHCDDGQTFLSRMTLSNMEELLPITDFMRTHRQYIVRLDKIESINFQDSTLQVARNELPLNRGKRKELGDLIKALS